MLRPCSSNVASSNKDSSAQTDLASQKVWRNSVTDIVPLPTSRKPPGKPLIPYIRYSSKVWSQVKAQNPDLQFREIGRIIGQMWREMPESEKTVFVEAYKADKLEYEKNLQTYHNFGAFVENMAGQNFCPQDERKKQECHDYSGSGSSKQSTFTYCMYYETQPVNVENEKKVIRVDEAIKVGVIKTEDEIINIEDEVIKTEAVIRTEVDVAGIDDVVKTEDKVMKTENELTKTDDVITGYP